MTTRTIPNSTTTTYTYGGSGVTLINPGVQGAPGASGPNFGIEISGNADTLINNGTVFGQQNAVYITGSGDSVLNAAGQQIIVTKPDQGGGVNFFNFSGTITNYGTISGFANAINSSFASDSVQLVHGGLITNTGTLENGSVYVTGSTGTLVNSGVILGNNAYGGVYFMNGGQVTNLSGGTISSNGATASFNGAPPYGVYIHGGSGTVTNAGTITGGSGFAVKFATTVQSRVIVDPGAVFVGTVTGGATAANATLELASSASIGTLSGLGTQFINFGTLTFDPSASWLVKASTAVSSATINGFTASDTIDLAGFIAVSDTFGSNLVTFTNVGGTHVALKLQGTFNSSNLHFISDGSTGTDIVGVAAAAAPTISGAVSGQTVNDNATLHPFSGVTISDANPGSPSETVTITVTHGGTLTDADGTLSGSGLSKTGTGTYQITVGSPAAVTSTLDALTFTPTAHQVAPGGTIVTGFTLSVTDTLSQSATDTTTTVIATALNTAPAIAGTAAGQTVNDNATLHPFSAASITDPDSSASETVSIVLTAGGSASDADGTLSGTGLTKTGTGAYSLTAGTPSAVTTALDALLFTPTAHQVAPGSTVTTGMTLSVTDGIVGSPTANTTTTVIATAVNTAPTITGTAAGQTVNDNATLHPFLAASITDPDTSASETVSIVVKFGGSASDADGTLSGTGLTKTGTGAYSLAAGTPSAVTTALDALLFTPTAHQVAPGSTVTTGMTLSVTDGIVGSPTTNTATTVIATAVNTAPTITGTAAGQTVSDSATLHPFSAASITDPDASASETVSIVLTAGGSASDADGTLSGTGLTKTGTGAYTLAAGTPSAVTTALDALLFIPTAHQVAPGSTVTTGMTLSVTDGIVGSPTTNTATTVIATAVNTAPVITGTAVGQTVNDNATLHPFSAASITDPGASPSETVSIELTAGGSASDADGTLSGTGLTKTGTGAYSLAAGTPSAVTTALDALLFTPTAHQVAPGSTVTTGFTLSVANTLSQSATDTTTTVIATAVNSPPAITGTTAGQTVNDNATLHPFSAASITDPDASSSETVSIVLTAGGSASDADGTLSGTGLTKTGTGAYTLAAGTPSAVTSALDALLFTPTAHQVIPGGTVTTGMTLSVTDGIVGAPTTNTTTTVIATAVNTVPSITGTTAGQAVSDNATDHPFSTAAIGDPDASATETLTITLTAGGTASDANGTLSGTGLTKTGSGTYTLTAGTPSAVTTALQTLLFTPTAHEVPPGSTTTTGMMLSVTDGIAGTPTTNTTTTVIATAAENAPVIAGTAAGQTVTDSTTDNPFSAATVSDPDDSATETLTITLTASGVPSDSNGALSGAGLTRTGTGTYTLVSGTPALVSAALQGLTFTPTAHEVTPNASVTTGMKLSVSDGIAVPTLDTVTTVVATAANDAPTIVGTLAGQATTDEATVTPFSGVVISDPDLGQAETVTITLSSAQNGALSSTSGRGSYNLGTGVYTVSGSNSFVTGAVEAVVFTPTLHQVAPGTTATTGFTLTATDTAGATTSDTTTTVAATAAEDPPNGLTLSPGSDSGILGDDVTDVTLPTITGTALLGSSISLYDAGILVGTGITDGGGNWSVTATTALTPGTNDLTATATDVADNISARSAPLVVTLDIPPPPTGPTLAPTSDSGVLGDGITNVTTPVLVGTGVARNTVELLNGLAVLGSATVGSDGTWSITPATLGIGDYSLTAMQFDVFGNVSAPSTALALSIQTAAPSISAALEANPHDDHPAGSVYIQLLAGGGDPSSNVTVSDNGIAIGTVMADPTGAWSFDPSELAPGVHALTATETNAAGNTATSAVVPLTVTPASVPDTRFSLATGVTSTSGTFFGSDYHGPVSNLQAQFGYDGTDNVTVSANVGNVFIYGGTAGSDVIIAKNGNNVLDSRGGSSWMVGGDGADGSNDTFFVDNRSTQVVWDTLLNFHVGDNLTVWGFNPLLGSTSFTDDLGTPGFTGTTLQANLGNGTGASDLVTFAGLSATNAKFVTSTGVTGGLTYFEVSRFA